jgi:all-trans-retinol 13,14-reductase
MNFLTERHPASVRYRQPTNLIDNPDAIIIGSGLGGLALASTLAQRRGMKVLVLEGAPTAGGSTHVHEVGGYEFPAGLHSVGDMDVRVNPAAINAWAADYVSGNQLLWAKMPEDHEYAFLGDEGFPWYSTAEANIEHFSKRDLGAGDLAGYFKLEAKVQSNGVGWAGTKLLPNAVPELVREGLYRLFSSTWRKYLKRDTHSVLRGDLGMSEKMAGLFEYMYGNYGRTPDEAPFTMHASVMYHYRKGAYFPVGGPGAVAIHIIPVIEAFGGQVAVSTRVKQIVVEGDRAVGVKLHSGAEIRSKLVISDASAYTTFMELLPREVAERHGLVKPFDHIKSSPSHITLMAGWSEHIELPRHIVWQMPRYHPEVPYADVSGGDRIYKTQMRFEGMPSYLMSPSARDPAHGQRYPNKTTMMLLVESNPKWLERCVAEPAFRAELEGRFKEAALKLMVDRFPALKGKAPAMAHVQFPMGCNPWARAGGSYGVEPSPSRFLEHTHFLRPRTTIDGLYMVGQDAFMPGIAGVLIGSRFAYACITGEWGYLMSQERSQFVPPLPKPVAETLDSGPRQVA